MLLGLDSLVQTIAPLSTFHDTSRLLVDNLHFAVDDDIFVVLVEHCICLEQLLQGMNAFALYAIVAEQRIFLLQSLLV